MLNILSMIFNRVNDVQIKMMCFQENERHWNVIPQSDHTQSVMIGHLPYKYRKIVTFLTPLMRVDINFFKNLLFVFRHLFTEFHNNNDDNSHCICIGINVQSIIAYTIIKIYITMTVASQQNPSNLKKKRIVIWWGECRRSNNAFFSFMKRTNLMRWDSQEPGDKCINCHKHKRINFYKKKYEKNGQTTSSSLCHSLESDTLSMHTPCRNRISQQKNGTQWKR